MSIGDMVNGAEILGHDANGEPVRVGDFLALYTYVAEVTRCGLVYVYVKGDGDLVGHTDSQPIGVWLRAHTRARARALGYGVAETTQAGPGESAGHSPVSRDSSPVPAPVLPCVDCGVTHPGNHADYGYDEQTRCVYCGKRYVDCEVRRCTDEGEDWTAPSAVAAVVVEADEDGECWARPSAEWP